MSDSTQVRVQMLGPLTAWRGPEKLAIGWPKQRAVLAVLALRSGRVVSRDDLVDAVWGENSHNNAASDVYKYISQLRRLVEPGLPRRASAAVLTTCVGGYSLQVPAESVDALVFEDRLRRGYETRAAGDHAVTATVLGEALELWHGKDSAPLGGVPGPFAEMERARLAELRLTAIEHRAAALLELGYHEEIIADHSRLVREHPTREQLWFNLILALYRSGRIADALARFREVRRTLVSRLGIEPGAELRTLNERVLAGDPSLDPPRQARGALAPQAPADFTGSGTAAVARPAQLPRGVPGFIGRARELRQLDLHLPDPAAPGGVVTGPPVVVALDGMPGVGKTALAVHWAYQVADRFPDGQLYLDLRGHHPNQAPLASEAVLGRFLRALGVAPDDVPPDTDERAALYRSLLADRRMLILLDNAVSAQQVGPLLPGNGDCVIVVTSRIRLGRLVREHGAHRLGVGVLGRQESMELLRGLLGAGRLDAEQAAAGQLCRLCDDLPLALRTVAANLADQPHTALSAAVAELSDGDRLSMNAADEEERCVVRGAFHLSYRVLPDGAQRLFRLLGMVPAPTFGRRAAAALAGRSVPEAAVELDRLAAANLIEQDAADSYRMRDLLRLYAAERAQDEDDMRDRQAALERLLEWYARGGEEDCDCAPPVSVEADSPMEAGRFIRLATGDSSRRERPEAAGTRL